MLITFLLLVAGLLILGIGAELLVSGSSRLAMHLGISPLIVGLTVVAFGTSAPELAVSIMSAAADHSSMALGNIIGSNIANIGLILGITAVIAPIRVKAQLVRQEIPLVILASIILGVMLLDGGLEMVDGGLLFSGLLAYLYFSYRQAPKEEIPENMDLAPLMIRSKPGKLYVHVILIVCGLALLIAGSDIFVDSAIAIARQIGVSEAVIGLSLIAIGTSVPELATAVLAAARKQPDIAVGNVIGSNIFNILCVLGTTSLISPVEVGQISLMDYLVMLLFVLLLMPMARSQLTVSRKEGSGLLLLYVAYLGFLSWTAM